MWRPGLAAALLCFALLPEQANALREREGSGFRLRSREAKLDEAFRNLRRSFEKNHPDWSKQSTETKTVTPPPFTLGEQNLLQLSNSHERSKHMMSNHAVSNNTEDVLFSIWTDSLFYDTRLAGILETWGKEIPPERFMAISDKRRNAPPNSTLPGTHVVETRCPAHSHWEGACCKWAEGVINAQEKMMQNPALKWAFFSDDDVYLLPGPVAAALREHDRAEAAAGKANHPQALGIFGCNTPTGCQGLCGGGGFAMNRAAVQRLAGGDPAAFLNEEMQQCGKCQKWADQAISMIWKDKGVEMQQLPGLNGWIMKEDDFKTVLGRGGNLLFHYEKNPHQLEALHEIFTGQKMLKEEKGPCVEYQGRKVCAASSNPGDVPFIAN